VQDGWSDHSDDDEASPYPSAPIPPHEREWRHPSELGPVRLRADYGPSFGRGVAITAGVVGVAVAVGIFQLVTPDRGPVNAGQANSVLQPTSPTPLPTSTLRASTTQAAPLTTAPSPVLPAPTLSPTTSLVRTPAPAVPVETDAPATEASTTTLSPVTTAAAPLPTVAVEPSGRSAVLWGSGNYAIASADGLALDSTTTIRASNATTYHAAVVVIGDGIAVLAIGVPASQTPITTATMPASGEPVMIESAAGTETAALEMDANGIGYLRPAQPVPSGCAVRDAGGSVVGVAVSGDGRTLRIVSASRIDQMVRNAESIGAWLGIIGTTDAAGATINSVAEGSPAQVAGVQPNDTIVAVDGNVVTSVDQVAALLRVRRAGQTTTLEVIRNGERIGFVVTLADRVTHSTTSVP
jgi:hypothetical protein